MLAADFGTPAQPRVRVPDWNEIAIAAVVRPNPANGVFGNMRDIAATALKKWKSAPGGPTGTQQAAKAELKLDDAALGCGSVLYRRWCLQCHGPTGAGDGAMQSNSPPCRDLPPGDLQVRHRISPQPKPGEKLESKKGLGPSGKPRREDLKRTVRNGLEGSMMPAFPTLSERELDDLVSYVIHLSIRGETEFATMTRPCNRARRTRTIRRGRTLEWLFDQNLMFVLDNWGIAAKNPIPIPPSHTQPTRTGCLRAPRIQALQLGGVRLRVVPRELRPRTALKWDLWGTVVQPRNLPLGVYRGGRRGEDLYARIYGGIHPAG